MSELSDGIREAISLQGAEVLKTDRLINILSDLRAFGTKGSRTALQSMLRTGLMDQVYDQYMSLKKPDQLFEMMLITRLRAEGFSESGARYVVVSVSRALGWTSLDPEAPAVADDGMAVSSTYMANGVMFTMCHVPKCHCAIGATLEQGLDAAYDERPAVEVTVDAFEIGQTPVTQALWEAVMGSNPSQFVGDDLPVQRVTWVECQEFIDRLNNITGYKFRLPTEAEWEIAARGATSSNQTKYSGADDDAVDEHVWHKFNSGGAPHIVCTKKPNSLGICDMSGNVGEWCADWYFNSYAGGSVNPKGPATGMGRVVRGGSFNDSPINCRVSRRMAVNPHYRSKQIGLRLAKNA